MSGRYKHNAPKKREKTGEVYAMKVDVEEKQIQDEQLTGQKWTIEMGSEK
jgi:hypothetical protein